MPLGSANYVSGLTGHISVGGQNWRLNKWSIPLKTKLVPVTNFESGGFQEMLACIKSSSISASGPYDQGNMGMTTGNSYAFVLVLNSNISISVTALIDSLELDDDAEGNATIKISAQSNGAFTITIT